MKKEKSKLRFALPSCKCGRRDYHYHNESFLNEPKLKEKKLKRICGICGGKVEWELSPNCDKCNPAPDKEAEEIEDIIWKLLRWKNGAKTNCLNVIEAQNELKSLLSRQKKDLVEEIEKIDGGAISFKEAPEEEPYYLAGFEKAISEVIKIIKLK